MLINRERLATATTQHDLAALVATAPENVLYSSGYWCLPQWIRRGPQAFVLLEAGDNVAVPVVITGTSTLDLVADQGIGGQIRRYGSFIVDTHPEAQLDAVSAQQAVLQSLSDDGNAIKALVTAIHESGLSKSRIGIDEMGLMPGDLEKLSHEFPDVKWTMAAEIFRNIRAVKTPNEIERLRVVGQITEQSIDAALAVARDGITEIEMARAFHACTVKGDGFPVLGCIGFGERSALMNVQPSIRRLNQGDIIRFDVGGHYRNYRADIARIASFGEPTTEILRKYRALYLGVQRGIEHIRPGVPASEIFRIVVETVRNEGIPHYQRSHVGHGIGLDGYDLPLLSASSKDILEAGMVLCIETPYYELGRIGLQVEDMLVVRPDGAEMLTNANSSPVVLAS